MRTEKAFLVLNFIKELGGDTLDFLEALSTSGRSAKRFSRKLSQLQYQRLFKRRQDGQSEDFEKQKRNLKVLLKGLKKDGLVVECVQNKRETLVLTKKGKRTLKDLEDNLLPVSTDYPRRTAGKQIIVAFDIPEKVRRKRDWLRLVLKNLGFTMIQKSLWSGENVIPEKLLRDCERLNLLDYIDIFEVVKLGTLKR